MSGRERGCDEPGGRTSWRAEVFGGIRKLAENRVTIDILHVLEQSGYDVGQVLRYLRRTTTRIL